MPGRIDLPKCGNTFSSAIWAQDSSIRVHLLWARQSGTYEEANNGAMMARLICPVGTTTAALHFCGCDCLQWRRVRGALSYHSLATRWRREVPVWYIREEFNHLLHSLCRPVAKKCAATALAAAAVATAAAAVAVALPLLRQTDNSRRKFELASTRMTTVDNDQSAGLRADRVQHRGIEHSSPTLYICQVDSFSLSLPLGSCAYIDW